MKFILFFLLMTLNFGYTMDKLDSDKLVVFQSQQAHLKVCRTVTSCSVSSKGEVVCSGSLVCNWP